MGILDNVKQKAGELVKNQVMAKLKEYGIDDSVLKDTKINIDKVKAHSKEINELLKKIIDGRKRRRSKSRSKSRSKKRSKRRRSKKRSSKRRY